MGLLSPIAKNSAIRGWLAARVREPSSKYTIEDDATMLAHRSAQKVSSIEFALRAAMNKKPIRDIAVNAFRNNQSGSSMATP